MAGAGVGSNAPARLRSFRGNHLVARPGVQTPTLSPLMRIANGGYRPDSPGRYDEEQDRVLVFVTNHLTLAAATVAEVYKQRWQDRAVFQDLEAVTSG